MPVDVRRRIAAHVLAAPAGRAHWRYTFIAALKEQSRKSPITKT
jgi:hypothetical protein